MGSTQTKSKKTEPVIHPFWFEIPVLNMDRAVLFYNTIFGLKMKSFAHNEFAMALFPEKSKISGALITGPGCIPSESGTLVYLNCKDIDTTLAKIEYAGGRIVLGKTLINEVSGYFALFIDSEGNKLALHSNF